jgi:predicted nucleotidyltransferase
MILFGSRARGLADRDSDVDPLLVGERFRRKGAIERAYPLYLEWDLDYPVNFLCYTPDEFKALSGRPSLVREAVRHGIPISASR